MDIVLCHITADFDTLGAAVAVSRLSPGTRIVLAGGCHPTVQTFLSFHRDEYPLIDRRAVDVAQVHTLTVVDTQRQDRLGPLADWPQQVADQGGTVLIYDHHLQSQQDIPGQICIEPVGATTTLFVERLQRLGTALTSAEATVMALGIHVDTGSLTFEHSTPRDALALAWLMAQGANQQAIATFVEPELSPVLQSLLKEGIANLHTIPCHGQTIGWATLVTGHYVPGLSGLSDRLLSLGDADVMVLAAWYPARDDAAKLTLIGRARSRVADRAERPGVNLHRIFETLGGGGHPTAASVTLTTREPEGVLHRAIAAIQEQIPHPAIARELMSSPVRTIRPETSIREAQRVLLRYGHSGLSVVDAQGNLVGIVSRRDIDLAFHHGFSHAPVKGYMTAPVKTITPETTLPEIEALMVTYDIGRLPVIEQGNLVGVVTRTDVLRQLHDHQSDDHSPAAVPLVRPPSAIALRQQLQARLEPDLWHRLQQIAANAEVKGWQLYLVGGAVRDFFLSPESEPLALQDVDLVVDGAHDVQEKGAGVVLAEVIQAEDPTVELQVYGRFQTAALIWHGDRATQRPARLIDIATARTEFYPYPAANPEVEASSIRQDLYRRDFTINAMAIQLTGAGAGRVLDFFGGLVDLQQRRVRVLHANSFIEDPTRIYRAVRFAIRLGFDLDPQTESFIHYAIESGIYTRLQQEMVRLPALQTRLKAELHYILEAPYWQSALGLLDKLGALVCLHGDLTLSDRLWHHMRRVSRWTQQLAPLSGLVPWQMRLEVLIAAIPEGDRERVAASLQLPAQSVERLRDLAQVEATLNATLPNCDRPSQIVHHLERYTLATLVLASVRHPRTIGRQVWRYIMVLAPIAAPLNGNDLRRLGYRPGPRYREILDALRSATLDGQVTDLASAEGFIQHHFPQQA